jgi:hypothetical protein
MIVPPSITRRTTFYSRWRRTFSMGGLALFSAADITHPDFDAHPERLAEYLGTDVSCD